MDGGHTIVRPNATENCCLVTVHSELEGAERCHLVEVCEGSAGDEPEVLPSNLVCWPTTTCTFLAPSIVRRDSFW